MEPSRFDELTKALATATSRRQALKALAATVGGLLGLGSVGTAFANCKPNGIGCNTNSQCCSGGCCKGTCTDLSSNPNNCGSCGHICRSDQVCSAGHCVCPTGEIECNGTCVNTNTNHANCGSCRHACRADETCQNGTCVCTNGGQECNGTCCSGNTPNCCSNSCTNTQSDANNCGQCGHVCASGETCASGACTCGTHGDCPGGQSCCSGMCVNEQTDPNNCGSCGHTCASGQTCQNGTCVTPPTCSSGGDFCDFAVVCGSFGGGYTCYCATDVDGSNVCGAATASGHCAFCTSDADCGAGWVCLQAPSCCTGVGGSQGTICVPRC